MIDRDLLRLRRRMGASVIDKVGAGRPILQALAKGGMVAIVVDQNVLRDQAVFVDFFGKAGRHDSRPGRLPPQDRGPDAAAVLPPGGSRYLLRILPPVEVAPSGRPGRRRVENDPASTLR